MKAPAQYVRLAERHWRTWLPRRVAELERTGQLQAQLQAAAARTVTDAEALRQHFLQQGLTPSQAQQRAWEIVLVQVTPIAGRMARKGVENLLRRHCLRCRRRNAQPAEMELRLRLDLGVVRHGDWWLNKPVRSVS